MGGNFNNLFIPRLTQENAALADAEYQKFIQQNPQLKGVPRVKEAFYNMYSSSVDTMGSGANTIGSNTSFAESMKQKDPNWSAADYVSKFYTMTQGNPNWKPENQGSRISDTQWFDDLQTRVYGKDPYLQRINDYSWGMNPTSGALSHWQDVPRSGWEEFRDGALIPMAAQAAIPAAAGGVSALAGGAAATTGGGVAGATGAEAVPGYFAGDTAGAFAGGNALATTGGAAGAAAAGAGKGGGAMGAGNWLDLALAAFGMGGSIYGANQAANIQKGAAEDALDFQREQWTQAQANAQPWITAGQGSVNALAGLMAPGGQLRDTTFTMDDFQADPGYQWRQRQGQNALAAQAAAAGNYGSGNMGTALLDYSQGLASEEYQNAYNRWNTGQNQLYNRLSNLAGLGQVANTALTNTGENAASAMGNASMAGANALASGSANTWNQVMGGLGAYLNYRQAQNAANQYGGYFA